MSREHVEFISEGEIDWQEENLTDDLPPIRNKLLSVDAETGAFTRVVALHDTWRAQSVRFPTTQELYVLDGQMTVDGLTLTPQSYVRIPAPVSVDSMSVDEQCRILWTSDSALDGNGDHEGHRFWKASESELTHVDAAALEWTPTAKEGPRQGLYTKYLHVDDQTGATTFLAKADGWTEPRQEHHDCVETSYTLDGGMRLGERGTMREGDYFWRPPWIRHGPMEPLDGFEAFMRVDRTLENHYTSVDGAPLNY